MAKKITAIILSLVMAFSLMSVAVIAAETEIKPYTPVTITVSADNQAVFKFVPEETKTLIVSSYASADVDPYCEISTLNESLIIDDSTNSTNFAEKYVFEAGVEYTLTFATYSDEDATFVVSLECAHEWDEDTCANCGKVCDHDAENARFKTCECGRISLTTMIELGETVDVTINGFDPVVRKFVPEEDVAAILYSDVFVNDIMYDASATIFNAAGEELAYNDDFAGSTNFVLWYEFEAGETYFIEVATYYEDLSFEFSLVKAAHTADDGAEHDVVFTDYQSGTCQELCYTEGLYCAECDVYFAGHVEDGYGFCWDDDWDGFCDTCGDFIFGGDDSDDDAAGGTISGFIAKIQEIINFLRNLVLKFFEAIIYR